MTNEASSASSHLESVIKSMPIISVIGAAAWGFWAYLDHDREAGRLSLDSARLSYNQTRDLAGLERDSRKLARDQQQFSLQQARLLSSTEKASKEISLKQQQFAYEQTVASAASIRDQQRFTAQLARLEAEQKSTDLSFQKKGRISYKATLAVECVSNIAGKYIITFNMEVNNISQQPVEVTWDYSRFFIGKDVSESDKNHRIIPLNRIPFEFEAPSSYPIYWREAYHIGHLYPGREEIGIRLPFDFQMGRGITSGLVKDESSSDSQEFIVWGQPGEIVSSLLLFGLDGNTVDLNGTVHDLQNRVVHLGPTSGTVKVYWTSDSVTLPTCAAQTPH